MPTVFLLHIFEQNQASVGSKGETRVKQKTQQTFFIVNLNYLKCLPGEVAYFVNMFKIYIFKDVLVC